MSWAADAAAGTATIHVTARTGGYVSFGWADSYNVMSPADVYAVWMDPASGEPVLSHRYNEQGYDAPTLRALSATSAVAFASSAGGTLSAQVTVPLPASVAAAAAAAAATAGAPTAASASAPPPGSTAARPPPAAVTAAAASPPPPRRAPGSNDDDDDDDRRRLLHSSSGSRRALLSAADGDLPAGGVNLIWCTGGSAPFSAEEGWETHGGEEGVDYGAAAIDLLCDAHGAASACVLAVGEASKFTTLHAIALAGFGATLGACMLAHALRRRLFALECAAQATLAHVPLLWRAAAAAGCSSFGAPEAVLLAGYFTTFALYLREALLLDAASPARAVGALLAPAFGVALLPVTRHSLWLPLLGVSYERSVAFHRASASVAMGVMVAHSAMMVVERGVPILTQRGENVRGDGAVFGTAAAATFAAMGALAAPPVRRASWELFKAAHLTFMPVAVVLSFIHARMMLGYVLPPLILWALDAALRFARSARTHDVTAVTPLPDGAVRLDVATRGALRVAPGQWAYVQIPGVSALESHPLSCVCAAGKPECVSFIIGAGRGAASFGARIAALADTTAVEKIRCRLDGCYGGPGLQLHRYTSVLLIAGGVGITPFVSIATHLFSQAPGAPGSTGSALRAASLVWAVRKRAAAEAWLPDLLPALRASALFTVRVCVTGEPRDAEHGARRRSVAYGRPDVAAAVRAAVAAAAEHGEPPRRVAVLACGPAGLVEAAQAAAAAQGCHFHAETFLL
jgi:ferredoxin-NADP reductase